ncbi:hypothetical protein DMC30DRAFT_395563, partial [Rhodotorula diobovata]
MLLRLVGLEALAAAAADVAGRLRRRALLCWTGTDNRSTPSLHDFNPAEGQHALVCLGNMPSGCCWLLCAVRPPVSSAGSVLVALALGPEPVEVAPPEPTTTGSEPSLVARSALVGIIVEGRGFGGVVCRGESFADECGRA